MLWEKKAQILAALHAEKDLAAFVRLYREYADLTQAKLAQLVNCSKTQITRIESGRHQEIRATWYITAVCRLIGEATGIEFDAEPYLDRTAQANSSTGYRGVCYSPVRQKYIATIAYKGKRFFLGYYSALDAAVAVRLTAEEKAAESLEVLSDWVIRFVKQGKSS